MLKYIVKLREKASLFFILCSTLASSTFLYASHRKHAPILEDALAVVEYSNQYKRWSPFYDSKKRQDYISASERETLLLWLQTNTIQPEHAIFYINAIACSLHQEHDSLPESDVAIHVQKIINLIEEYPYLLEKILTETVNDFEYIYQYCDKSQQDILATKARSFIEHTTKQKLKYSITELLAAENLNCIPYCVYLKNPLPHKTQTESHFFHNIEHTLHLLRNCSKGVISMLIDIYKKECEERARGNYVFYHGQTWQIHLYADIYKQLWNMKNKNQTSNDFTFLRFKQNTKVETLMKDSVFLNHSLFGNSRTKGCCSLTYFLESKGATSLPSYFSLEDLFEEFDIVSLYNKYEEELEDLEYLHEEAKAHGNMLLISVPPHKLHFVNPTIVDGSLQPVEINHTLIADTRLIIDTLINKPQQFTGKTCNYDAVNLNIYNGNRDSDAIEYAMPLTTEYALDPRNGPRIYSFNAADQDKLKAYEAARDALFAKIKHDLETEKK